MAPFHLAMKLTLVPPATTKEPPTVEVGRGVESQGLNGAGGAGGLAEVDPVGVHEGGGAGGEA